MATGPIRVAINGFGRIGRSIARILMSTKTNVELVLINDIAPVDACAYLLKYDSVFGVSDAPVEVSGHHLVLGAAKVPFFNSTSVRELSLSQVDVFMECTGQSDVHQKAQDALAAGAKRVIISGPCAAAEATLILGANEDAFSGQRIVSNGSCTTNALAPLIKLLDDLYGVVSGQMTTVHCYTSSQPSTDQYRGDFARSRAAALSMVPTTTSAHKLIDKVLPHLAGKIQARALRVPTPSVSAIDLTVLVARPAALALATEAIRREAAQRRVIGWTDEPLVSTDLRTRSESLILCGPELSVGPSGLIRVFGWYDNEWGFSNRMIEMAQLVAAKVS